ncbi:MAG: SDR family NAD(P)-dependent oxidoreductase [Candidatus Saccharibacteria bacterium]|nr:SDR family NAD(P)-dependent oxidoreductase [Pseudorhodobacter sp.]
MPYSAIAPGHVAVITGGASGIGLAAAERFAARGLRVVIADLGADRLEAARLRIQAAGASEVMALQVDVADPQAIADLQAKVAGWGGADVVMLNAGIGPDSTILGPAEVWQRMLAVNLWGAINGAQAFLPGMLAGGRDGLIICTGSKQGITTPPGNPAYNVAKAGVKVFAEALEHDLRNRPDARITAHLLIPGFVYTGLTTGATEKPAAAWTAEQTVDFMMTSLERGDFYILCPDNDVPRALDEQRILWAAGDIVENRPPLSRWHKDHAAAFQAQLKR